MNALQLLITVMLLCADGFYARNGALDGSVKDTALRLMCQSLILEYGATLFMFLERGILVLNIALEFREPLIIDSQFIRKLRRLIHDCVQ